MILSDRDTKFTSGSYDRTIECLGIKLCLFPSNPSQTNGQTRKYQQNLNLDYYKVIVKLLKLDESISPNHTITFFFHIHIL